MADGEAARCLLEQREYEVIVADALYNLGIKRGWPDWAFDGVRDNMAEHVERLIDAAIAYGAARGGNTG